MPDVRSLPVPDGLAGERVDAGLSRLLGLSRSAVADLAEAGDVLLDGQAAGKSSRLRAGAWLEVTLPSPETAADATPPRPRCRTTSCGPPSSAAAGWT